MLNIQKLLKIGQLVHIEITDYRGSTQRYPSRIENISNEKITLASPMKNRIPIYVNIGSEVSIWFWDSVAIYTFNSVSISNDNEGVALFTINSPEKIERVQNRDYVRVQTNIDVAVRSTTRDDEEILVNCKTRDLSGGGMMLVLTKHLHLKKDPEVYLEFELDGERIQSMGLIVWNDWELDSEGIERNILGVKFTTVTESNRQNIVRYVYKKQIELRRKGLL